jgi:hypothetical protein
MVKHIFRKFHAPPVYGSFVLNMAMTRRWSQIVMFFQENPSLYDALDAAFLIKTLTDWRNDQKDIPLLLSCLSDEKLMSFLSEDQIGTLWQRFARARDYAATKAFVENPRVAEVLSLEKWKQSFTILKNVPKAFSSDLIAQMVHILLNNYRISYDFEDWKGLLVHLDSEKNFKALSMLFKSDHAMVSIPKDELAEFFLSKFGEWDAATFDAFLSNKFANQALALDRRILAQESLKPSHLDGRYKLEAFIRTNLNKAMPPSLSSGYWDSTFQQAMSFGLYDTVKVMIQQTKVREAISMQGYQRAMTVYEKSLLDRVPGSSLLLDLLTAKDMWPVTLYTLYFIDWMKLIRLSLDDEWASEELLNALQEDPGRYSALVPRFKRADSVSHTWSVDPLSVPGRLPIQTHQTVRALNRHSPSLLPPAHPHMGASHSMLTPKTRSRTPKLPFVHRPVSHGLIPAVPHFRLPL